VLSLLSLRVLQHTAARSLNRLRTHTHTLSLSPNRHRCCHCPCSLHSLSLSLLTDITLAITLALLHVPSSHHTHILSVLQHTATHSLINLCTHILPPFLNRHRSCHCPCPLRNVHTHRVCCNTLQHSLSTDFAHTHTHTLSLSTDIALAIALALLRVPSSHQTHTLSVLQHTATHSRNNLCIHILSLSLNRHHSCHCPCSLRITHTH